MKNYHSIGKVIFAILAVCCFLWIIFQSREFFTKELFTSKIVSLEVLLCLLLMPLNWSLEAYKIYSLTYGEVSFLQSIKAVLKGLSFSFFTPFGLGSYIGRSIQQRINQSSIIVQISFISSIMQTAISILFGIVALKYLSQSISNSWIQQMIQYGFFTIVVLCLISIILYFYFEQFQIYILDFIRKFWHVQSIRFAQFSLFDLSKLFIICCIRYAVYVFQFVVLLNLFEYFDFISMLSIACIIYCIQSLIYLPSTVNAVARGALLAFIFSLYLMPESDAYRVSWLLFWINIAIPTIIGFIYLILDSKENLYEKISVR